MKKIIKKLIKEVLAHSVLSDSEMREFLKNVYKNMLDVLNENEVLVLESAFNAYRVADTKDIDKMSAQPLQNLFNSVDTKLKSLNVREFHFVTMSGKNIKLSDLL